MIDRVPVDLRFFTLDEASFQEVEKQPLLMLVVGRIAGRDLAAPVEGQPHRLELLLHGGDVLVGPRLGMDLVGHRRILGRHAEGIPAHRMQHIEALGAFVARDHVAHRIIANVAHMDASRGIREHLEHVVFRLRIVVFRREDFALVPDLLPARLGFAGVIALRGHYEIGVLSAG